MCIILKSCRIAIKFLEDYIGNSVKGETIVVGVNGHKAAETYVYVHVSWTSFSQYLGEYIVETCAVTDIAVKKIVLKRN